MSESTAAFIVTLADDARKERAEAIQTALAMVKGVLAVDPVPANAAVHIAETRADRRHAAMLHRLASQVADQGPDGVCPEGIAVRRG